MQPEVYCSSQRTAPHVYKVCQFSRIWELTTVICSEQRYGSTGTNGRARPLRKINSSPQAHAGAQAEVIGWGGLRSSVVVGNAAVNFPGLFS
jgi:hypothetical protein